MPVASPPAGSLNRRVTLQTGTPGSTAEGDAVMTWVNFDVISCNVSPMGATEQLLAAQRGEEITHQLTTRYRNDLPPAGDIRLLLASPSGANRVFFVVGIYDPDEGHRSLVLRCKEYVTSQAGAY